VADLVFELDEACVLGTALGEAGSPLLGLGAKKKKKKNIPKN
jgi:hypothetical protein